MTTMRPFEFSLLVLLVSWSLFVVPGYGAGRGDFDPFADLSRSSVAAGAKSYVVLYVDADVMSLQPVRDNEYRLEIQPDNWRVLEDPRGLGDRVSTELGEFLRQQRENLFVELDERLDAEAIEFLLERENGLQRARTSESIVVKGSLRFDVEVDRRDRVSIKLASLDIAQIDAPSGVYDDPVIQDDIRALLKETKTTSKGRTRASSTTTRGSKTVKTTGRLKGRSASTTKTKGSVSFDAGLDPLADLDVVEEDVPTRTRVTRTNAAETPLWIVSLLNRMEDAAFSYSMVEDNAAPENELRLRRAVAELQSKGDALTLELVERTLKKNKIFERDAQHIMEFARREFRATEPEANRAKDIRAKASKIYRK